MVASISSSAMLCDVSITSWTARKLDRSVTEEVNTSKKASAQASRVNKNLLPGVKQLQKIQQYASATRNWVYTQTLPWSDGGARLIPTASYFDFKKELDERREKFFDLVDEFLAVYPTLINAQQFELGSMFNRDEYPPAEEVAKRFSFDVVYSPVPESGDFRLDINSEAVKDLQEDYERQYNYRLEQAMLDVRSRLLRSLKHLSDRMTDEDGKRKKFQSTILDMLAETLTQVRQLNLTKDDILNECVTLTENTIDGLDVEDLRESDYMRKRVKDNVDSILEKLSL